ncbi:MAG: hypothetical protein RL637_1743 [Pseudomonadota bacterium]|jgi:hypothetical protein
MKLYFAGLIALLNIVVIDSAIAESIKDIRLTAFDFDVVHYEVGSDPNGKGGDATASGTSNGIPWTITPTSLWKNRTVIDGSFKFKSLPNATDNLHPSGDYTITFAQKIDSLLVALSNNDTNDSINFNLKPSDYTGTVFSGSQVTLNNKAGGLVLFENIHSLTIHNLNNNGITDGYDLAFHAVKVTSTPIPAGIWLFAASLGFLLKRKQR